jgi:hypothetical protein
VLRFGARIGGNGTVKETGSSAVEVAPVVLVAVTKIGKFESGCEATAASMVRAYGPGPGSAPVMMGLGKSAIPGNMEVVRVTSGMGPEVETTVT